MKIECSRCGKKFNVKDINIYDGDLLCDDCEDEVKDEIGSPHDYIN